MVSSRFPGRSVFPECQVSVLSVAAPCSRELLGHLVPKTNGGWGRIHICTSLLQSCLHWIWYLWAHRSSVDGWPGGVTLPLTFQRCLHPRCCTSNELSGRIPSGSIDQLDTEQTGTNWSQPAYDERGPRAERTPPGTRFTGEDINGAGFQAGAMCLLCLEDGLCGKQRP